MLKDTTVAPAKNTPNSATDSALRLAGTRKVLIDWIEALSTKNIDALLALYAEEAILVPTLQNYICRNSAERQTYFEKLLANPGLTCQLDSVHLCPSRTARTATAAGHYTFSFKRNGIDETIPARFLYSLEEIDGAWLIIGHHSSKFV